MFILQFITAPPSNTIYEGLIELLRDAVEGGASVGFLSPLKRELAEVFWRDMLSEVGTSRVMLIATTEEGDVAGSVQLALGQKENDWQQGLTVLVPDTIGGEWAER